jgi:hypothetical protein
MRRVPWAAGIKSDGINRAPEARHPLMRWLCREANPAIAVAGIALHHVRERPRAFRLKRGVAMRQGL